MTMIDCGLVVEMLMMMVMANMVLVLVDIVADDDG